MSLDSGEEDSLEAAEGGEAAEDGEAAERF